MSEMRLCPICQTSDSNASLFHKRNIDHHRISGFSYASRKVPEFMCHTLVRCGTCDIVYATDPPDQDELAQAYHEAEYDSSDEAIDAAKAYMVALQPILTQLPRSERVLEIGSGTGVLLDFLNLYGFKDLVGVEPSGSAIAAAPLRRQAWLREGIFDERDFEPSSFDLICCFMTMEHVRDPLATANAAYRLLRPGGVFVTVTHDYCSFVNRLLGKRSPIIDIEHMQIFSNTSITALFQRCGFDAVMSRPFTNRYSLSYWMRLTPLPLPLKRLIQNGLVLTHLNTCKIGINVGNTLTAGVRPKTQT